MPELAMELSKLMQELLGRMAKLEEAVDLLIRQKTVKEWYSTAEIAKILCKAEFTVREWARLGRIAATKKQCGRGAASEWMISHDELTRIRNEGLLPDARAYRHVR